MYSFEDFKSYLESLGFSQVKKYTHFDYGEWAVKRLEELKITRSDSERGFYFVTAMK